MNLFNKKILIARTESYKSQLSSQNNSDKAELRSYLIETLDRINSGKFGKEESEKPRFLGKFFEFLGYSHDTDYKLEKSSTTGSSDAALGDFMQDKIAVSVEWKGVDHKDLERKKTKTSEAPVTQLFRYMADQQSKIGIVSNFLEIRIYHWDFHKERFYTFKLVDLVANPQLIDHLYYLLCKDNVLTTNPVITLLARITTEEEKLVTAKFYMEFKGVRKQLFEHLLTHNPEIEPTLILEKTQKFLDRFTFALVAEDVTLLPRVENNMGIIRHTYNIGKSSRDRGDEKIWIQFKNLFQDIDEGRSDISPKIPEYNGGLFKTDALLDNLHIKDSVWPEIVDLEKYDFASELNVNILGHIFEQSISDIEAIKAEIVEAEGLILQSVEEGLSLQNRVDSENTENGTINVPLPIKKISKRKKDGIYYTPEYITKYIVENTIGRYLDENPDKLESIKVLDPACGSGAFLNQAHSYLVNRYKQTTPEDETGDLLGTNQTVQDKIKALKSIYGVDLQPESVEISKLSLWLKTADREHKLENLDSQIKCGNSLIDDPEIAGDRAFDWGKEYPDMFAEAYPYTVENPQYYESKNGFDVIIGNPPYVRHESITAVKPHLESNYETYMGTADLYVYFFEKALKTLKEGGYMAYVVSNKFSRAGYGQKLRQWILENFTIVEYIDHFDNKVFDDAVVDPCIIIIKKAKAKTDHKIVYNKNETVLQSSLSPDGWSFVSSQLFDLKNKIEKNGTKIKDLDIMINRGILTGFNQAFIIDKIKRNELIAKDPKNAEIIKPILRGRDISRYNIDFAEQYLIVAKNGINISQEYPAIANFFNQKNIESGGQMENRWDKGNHWMNLRNCAYYGDFEKPKIVWKEMVQEPSFVLDNKNYFSLDTTTFLIGQNDTNLLYILGILDSKASDFIFRNFYAGGGLGENGYRYKKNFLLELPVPKATLEEQEKLAIMVDKIMTLKADLHTREQGIKSFLKDNYGLEVKKTLPEYADIVTKLSNLTLLQKEELHSWYTTKKTELLAIENEANGVDNQIDTEVYRLYGLTSEDIGVIENDNKKT